MIRQTIHIPLGVEAQPSRALRAGRLNCLYERGNLRYIKCGEIELLRMIYGAVRDQDWNTIPYSIIDEEITQDEASFAIQYTALYNEAGIQYKAFFQISGTADSEISFSMKGEALTSFSRNRIGLCVHHPVKEHAGNQVHITRLDGSTYTDVFPELVSPDQPFFDIQKMSWSNEQCKVQLLFEGEVFETEDQRNWGDYSFKTYGTPIAKPFPVLVQVGEKIDQRVILKADVFAAENISNTRLDEDAKRSFPKTGFCRTKGERRVQEVSLLRNLPLQHYRIELRIKDEGWKDELIAAAEEASQLYSQLELVVFFTDSYQVEVLELLEMVRPIHREIYSVLPLHHKEKVTPVQLLNAMYQVFKKEFAQIRIGYGTDAYFAELNRTRPQTVDFDFISFSLNPQVHAADERSIIENLAAQQDMVRTARSFAGGKEVHVSPVTFGRRNNPDAISSSDVEFPIDPRSKKGMGAAWILNSIFYLSEADRVTYCQSFGKNGMIHRSGRQSSFKGYENAFSPVFEFLSLAGSFKPQYISLNDATGIDKLKNIILENRKGDKMIFIIDDEC